MKELFLDASKWNTLDDLYDSFFEAVEAPAWHGRNLDAVYDSVGSGQINGIEVPYCIVVRNYDLVSDHLKENAVAFVGVLHDLAKEGIPVEIRLESSN